MTKNKKNVAVTPEQLEVAARRFRLKSGVRAGKNGTGYGPGGSGHGKAIVSNSVQASAQ